MSQQTEARRLLWVVLVVSGCLGIFASFTFDVSLPEQLAIASGFVLVLVAGCAGGRAFISRHARVDRPPRRRPLLGPLLVVATGVPLSGLVGTGRGGLVLLAVGAGGSIGGLSVIAYPGAVNELPAQSPWSEPV